MLVRVRALEVSRFYQVIQHCSWIVSNKVSRCITLLVKPASKTPPFGGRKRFKLTLRHLRKVGSHQQDGLGIGINHALLFAVEEIATG